MTLVLPVFYNFSSYTTDMDSKVIREHKFKLHVIRVMLEYPISDSQVYTVVDTLHYARIEL